MSRCSGLLILALLNVSAGLMAQNPIDQYLKSALLDPELDSYDAQRNFLADNNYNSPWLSRLEFRIGSEDANASLNEYRVRVTPTNPYEIKANKQYYEKHVQSLNTGYEIALSRAMKRRYETIIETYGTVQMITLIEQQIESLRGLNRAAANDLQNVDLGDIVDIQSDETRLLLNREEYRHQKSQLDYQMSLDHPDMANVDWTGVNWMSIDQIYAYIRNRENIESTQSLYITRAEEDLDLRKQMLKIDKAEARSNIGYIQANFDTERGNEINEHLGFQVGVRIPIVNPDKPKINRDRVELIEREKKVEEVKREVSTEKEQLLLEMNSLVARYQLLTGRIETANRVKVQGGNVDLGGLEKLTFYRFDLHQRRMRVEARVRLLYIEYLDMQGLLSQRPMINYLSPDLKTLESE